MIFAILCFFYPAPVTSTNFIIKTVIPTMRGGASNGLASSNGFSASLLFLLNKGVMCALRPERFA